MGKNKMMTIAIVAAALIISGVPISQIIGIILICYGAAKVAGVIVGSKR